MKKLLLLILSCLLLNQTSATVQTLAGVIQSNVFGVPILHNAQKWEFDPDAGIRRSAQYQQANGYLGENLIERLGLGIDGNEQSRLVKQQNRDKGHLGGLNFYKP